MDSNEREYFYKYLVKHKDENIINFNNIIKFPKSLYRYRSVNMNNLSALLNNEMYFSSSNFFDDPFDTNIYVSKKKILDGIFKYIINDNSLDTDKIQTDSKNIGININKFNLSQVKISKDIILQRTALLFNNVVAALKKETLAVCFSESELNETLWLKYANNYNGFCIEYDINDILKLETLEKEDKNKIVLYPIIYTDEKYDETEFGKNFLIAQFLELSSNNDLFVSFVNEFNKKCKFDRELIALIKKKCHEYDKEWRLIKTIKGPNIFTNCNEQNVLFKVKIKPKSVTLGLRMNSNDKKTILTLAKQAGIQEIYELYIDDDMNLNKKALKE